MAKESDREPAPHRHPRAGGVADTDALSSLLAVLRAVRARWWMVLLIAVPMVAAAWWYAEQLPEEYTSEALVLVEPRPEAGAATGTAVVRLKAPSYVAYLTAPATTQRLDEQLGLEQGTVEELLDAQVQSESANVVVTATAESAERASQVADAAAQELVAFSSGDELLQAQLLAPSVVPEDPSGPPRRMIQAAALAAALALGLVAAIAVERRRPRIEDVADVEALTSYELLGRIPRRRRLPEAPGLAFADPAVGTAVRSLRVRLSGELPAGGAVTVTSSVPGEGKSTTAALLATSFARTGVDVCLVDGDLRRPSLADHLDDWDGVGLDRLLNGDAVLAETLVAGWTEHLTVLPTAADAGAGESLAERMPAVLRDLRTRFELVVIDAPHVLGSDEARVLASGSDRVVLVVAPGTPQDAVDESRATLAGLRADVAGYVLNRSASVRYGAYDHGS